MFAYDCIVSEPSAATNAEAGCPRVALERCMCGNAEDEHCAQVTAGMSRYITTTEYEMRMTSDFSALTHTVHFDFKHVGERPTHSKHHVRRTIQFQGSGTAAKMVRKKPKITFMQLLWIEHSTSRYRTGALVGPKLNFSLALSQVS
nr:hypothetical protein CFP56_52156 [Quercus suber]